MSYEVPASIGLCLQIHDSRRACFRSRTSGMDMTVQRGMDRLHAYAGGAHNHSSSGHRATTISDLHHPDHGNYEGHLLPGLMFIFWSMYWLWSVFDIYLRTLGLSKVYPFLPDSASSKMHTRPNRLCPAGRNEPFRSRAWYPLQWRPLTFGEPVTKITLPLLGIVLQAVALKYYFGGFGQLYEKDGHFAMSQIPYWAHVVMYGGFIVSGIVDLIGYYTPLPAGTEQGFLAVAFVFEALMMGSHTKPYPLDSAVHQVLTAIMVACVVACAAEVAAPNSLVVALLRPMLVLLQGTWFWHVGAILYTDTMRWDIEDMGAVMFVPIVVCVHIVMICCGTLTGYLGMRWAYAYAGITSPRAYSDAGVYQYTPLSKDDKQASARPLQTSIAGSAHPSNDFSCGSLAKQDHIELAVADGTTQAVVLGKLG